MAQNERENEREMRIKTLQSELVEKRRKLEEINKNRKELLEKKRREGGDRAAAADGGSPMLAVGSMSSPSSTSASPMLRGQYGSIRGSAGNLSRDYSSGIDFAQLSRKLTMEESQRTEAQVAAMQAAQGKTLPKLSLTRHIVFDVPPAWKESYSKDVQTDLTADTIQKALERPVAAPVRHTAPEPEISSPPLAEEHLPADDSQVVNLNSSFTSSRSSLGQLRDPENPPPETQLETLTPAELRRITTSQGFGDFLSRTSLLMERALNVNFDVIMDTTYDADVGSVERTGEKARVKGVFFDEKWSKNKAVTSLNFNPKSPEFFLASYYSRQDAHNKANKYSGSCVLVYSVHLPQRAAYMYNCQGDIAKAFYCKHRPNMIIGSTYAGQIVAWDTRAGSDPVMRSPLSSEAHTHPVFGLDVVGTANSHLLVSLSTDGRYCTWNLENMSQPQECIDLVQLVDVGESRVKKDITACTLAFAANEMNKFFVGSEDGGLYAGNRHGGTSHITEKYEGHVGPITATHCHPSIGVTDELSDLIVTSSMDWTCKLWSQKRNRCIYSFDEYQEYVYDVSWSPTHPSMFASVDGKGEIQVWDLSQTMEIPISKIDVTGGISANKLAWSPDGRSIIVGDIRGNLYHCELSSEVATGSPECVEKLTSRVRDLVPSN